MCGVAAAEPRVDGKLSTRAIDAIRIQLSDIDADVSITIEQAAARELVVTIETEDRTIVRTIEIASGRAEDVERALALKIAGLVERALAIEPLRISEQPTIDFPSVEMIEHVATPLQDARGYVAELGIDGLVGKTALHVAGGVEWRGDRVVIETVASVRGSPEMELAMASGRLRVADANAMLGMRVFTTHSIIAVGAHADVGVRRLDVAGVASDGRMGESRWYVLAASPGVDVRWLMTPHLEVRAAVSALLTFDRPVFSLDGMAAADIAAPAAVTTMSIVFLAP